MGTQMITGDEPLADGMHLVIRLRCDFTVTDAARLMAAARAAYIELNPGATEHDAEQMVTCAADAIFAIFERDGLLGQPAEAAIASYADDGLEPGGWRAQVTANESRSLPPGPDCFDRGDIYALPQHEGHRCTTDPGKQTA